HHWHPLADRGGNAWQRRQWRNGAIELTTTMVGNDQSVDAFGQGNPGVARIEQTLDHQHASPALANMAKMGPVEMILAPKIARDIFRKDRRAPCGIGILEMRQPVLRDGAQKRAERPARMGDAVKRQPQRGPQWRAEIGTNVVLAIG